MGHKVHPSGMRRGLRSEWPSRWFSTGSKYTNQLIEDINIRKQITEKYNQAGIEDIIIKRNANLLEIEIRTAKPGIIIGRSGAGAKGIKLLIEKLYIAQPKNLQPHIRINIVEIKNPDLSAQLIAENIARAIERRINVRRAVQQALERAKEKGVKGMKIRVSGRLNGVDIARSEYVNYGSVPLSTLKSKIDYSLVHALTGFGIIGVKVWVYRGIDEPLKAKDRD